VPDSGPSPSKLCPKPTQHHQQSRASNSHWRTVRAKKVNKFLQKNRINVPLYDQQWSQDSALCEPQTVTFGIILVSRHPFPIRLKVCARAGLSKRRPGSQTSNLFFVISFAWSLKDLQSSVTRSRQLLGSHMIEGRYRGRGHTFKPRGSIGGSNQLVHQRIPIQINRAYSYTTANLQLRVLCSFASRHTASISFDPRCRPLHSSATFLPGVPTARAVMYTEPVASVLSTHSLDCFLLARKSRTPLRRLDPRELQPVYIGFAAHRPNINYLVSEQSSRTPE